jgi:hypothetical protein
VSCGSSVNVSVNVYFIIVRYGYLNFEHVPVPGTTGTWCLQQSWCCYKCLTNDVQPQPATRSKSDNGVSSCWMIPSWTSTLTKVKKS